MYVDLNQVFLFVVAIPWFGMTAVLFSRFRTKQREYLRNFASQGISLDFPLGSIPSIEVRLARRWVMLHRQTNPELEQLRREMWRRYGLVALWTFGFPLFIFAMIVLLGMSGLLHYQ